MHIRVSNPHNLRSHGRTCTHAAVVLQKLKHEHQQARQSGNAERARELELRIGNLIEVWGLAEDEEEARLVLVMVVVLVVLVVLVVVVVYHSH